MKPKLAYITGTRAEYGIVKRLLRKLKNEDELIFSLLVTAMHLDPIYGYTVEQIKNDGFDIDAEIPIEINILNNHQILCTISECIKKFSAHFSTCDYDAILILGDRYEIFAVAIAAAMHNIPIIHLHGGEKTLGNYDEFIRHSITKMSKLHLVSTDEYRRRVVQLGENPNNVINIGSLGVENIFNLKLYSKNQVHQLINYTRPYFVVLFHPETLTGNNINQQISILLSAIDRFCGIYDFVILGSNADTSSNIIKDKVKKYCSDKNFCYFESLSTEQFFSVVMYSEGFIGNSSSGIIEVPSLGVPTINLGQRQLGRMKGHSIIDCNISYQEIIESIKKSQTINFRNHVKEMVNPYAKSNCLDNAYRAIVDFIWSEEKNKLKDFYDIRYFVS